MNKKILIISSIILGIIVFICFTLLLTKKGNAKINENKLENQSTSTKQESIIDQNNIYDTVATSIETEEKENKDTKEKELDDTKEEVKLKTEDKNNQDTKDKKISKNTKETGGTVETKVETTVTTVPTKKEEPAPQPVVEPEPIKPVVEEPKVESKKIDLSKYDYYENSLNGSYKGFVRDDAEISKLKSLIDTCISEFGYTNVKVVQDSSLAQSGLRSFTANKTNVENAVYDSDGFTICYYAVKEYHISSDGIETLFQTRSYIKVR